MSTNSVVLAAKYAPILDEVYKRSALTAPLEVNPKLVSFTGANSVNIFKTAMDGLGDYSRSTGYVAGGVQGSWETLTLAKDRGRKFQIDVMDNEETLDMYFGTLVGEFMRTRVVPELDAYRFAKLAGTSNIDAATPADITIGTTDVPGLVDAAEASMGDNEVPVEGRILFVSEKAYAGLKAKITRYLANENNVNREVEVYNGMRVIRVPQARFCTGITLYDGTTNGQTDGGYKFSASTSYPINFMIVHPSAVIQVTKHALPRIFSPIENQAANAWAFDYRVYHDIFVQTNKVKGIYLHKASTALASNITG